MCHIFIFLAIAVFKNVCTIMNTRKYFLLKSNMQ